MLDRLIADSPHAPPSTPSPVGHLSCTQASHEDLKVTVRTWLEYRANWPEALPTWLNALTDEDQRKLGGWLTTKRPWPGTTLIIGECVCCKSTLAVCGACRDEGTVETGYGPGAREEQCECAEVVL